jgi:hypothetical protein
MTKRFSQDVESTEDDFRIVFTNADKFFGWGRGPQYTKRWAYESFMTHFKRG